MIFRLARRKEVQKDFPLAANGGKTNYFSMTKYLCRFIAGDRGKNRREETVFFYVYLV